MRETERRKEKKEDETHTHTHTHTQSEREKHREREKEQKNDCSKIRLGATILTGKSKVYEKRSFKGLKKTKKTKGMERKFATKIKQLPFLIPQTHTREHKPTRLAWC